MYGGVSNRRVAIRPDHVRPRRFATKNHGFDSPLSDKQSLRHRIADAETRLHVARTAIRDTADQIAAGDEARVPVSMCKVFTANVTKRHSIRTLSWTERRFI